jgi:acetyl-CoA carboxylase biotin carboxyl carrier protein
VARGRSVKRSKPAPARARKGSAGARPAKPAAFPEVEQLVELMDRHGLLEVDWEGGPDGLRRVRLSRVGTAPPAGHAGAAPAVAHAPVGHAAHAAHAAATAARPAAPPAEQENLHVFKSPMVGTFYRAPSPEAAPFVSVGDKVDEHATVCIIEAMKVMNEITPDKAGVVVSVEVENGEAVEFGQPLLLIRPA